RDRERVPAPEPKRRPRGDGERHDRRAGERGERDDARLKLPTRPARPVGDDRDVATASHRRYERAPRLASTARRRAPHTVEHEARGAGANAGLAELTLELPERGALRVERLAAPEKPQRLATEALAGRRLLV